MHLPDEAYRMPVDALPQQAARQFAMIDLVGRKTWQGAIYERGGWYLLLVHAERTDAMDVLEAHEGPDRAALDAIGNRIGYGRAQQILGELWEQRHDCAPRGRIGVTIKDADGVRGGSNG